MNAEQLLINNDMEIRVEGLQDQEGTYYDNADLELTLETLDGSEVSGQTWPVSMSYVSGTDATYKATIQDTVDISEGQAYIAHIVGSAGGLDIDIRLRAIAVYRRE